jgi:hypothetical protein
MMKYLFVLLALASPAGLIASPAVAAPDTARSYAACLAEKHGPQARELLQASTSAAVNSPYRALVEDDRCISRAFGNQQFSLADDAFSTPTLRGNLAEQLLLKQTSAVAALQPLPLQQKLYFRPWFAATGRHPAVDEMAACMADTDPAGILALIKADVGAADETAAFGAMSSALTKCLSAGTQLDVGREAIRAALADALYQRFNNPSLSIAGVKN